jgi:hypothetical protein
LRAPQREHVEGVGFKIAPPAFSDAAGCGAYVGGNCGRIAFNQMRIVHLAIPIALIARICEPV